MFCNLLSIKPTVAKTIINPSVNQSRLFWEYVNMMFNKPDAHRIKEFGPDRTCAEWVLRNGGKVVWEDGRELADYNLLPAERHPVPKLLEIDGSDCGISHYGFPHLIGCTKLKKIILHNNNYIDDRALQGLSYCQSSLSHLQVSRCCNVTDFGVTELKILDKLEMLVLFELISVNNLNECKQFLQTTLPNCIIK